MSAELFLIVPPDLPADRVLAALGPVLAANPPSALLLQRGELAENAYKALVKAVVPVDLPRPRDRASAAFQAIVRELEELVKEEVRRAGLI